MLSGDAAFPENLPGQYTQKQAVRFLFYKENKKLTVILSHFCRKNVLLFFLDVVFRPHIIVLQEGTGKIGRG